MTKSERESWGKRHISETMDFLDRLKSQKGSVDIPSELAHLDYRLKEVGCSLEDIGSSKEELKKLLEAYYRRRAEEFLKNARSEKGKLDFYRDGSMLDIYIKYANCTLSDIGTSEEELDAFIKESHQLEAKDCLKRMRSPDPRYHDEESVLLTMSVLCNHLEDANCSLEDIGTSKEELEKILQASKEKTKNSIPF